MDWVAFGLPTEGKKANVLRVTAPMRRDVPTCALTDRIGDVRQATRALDWDLCVVVDERRVVLGLLYGKAWDAAPETPAEEIMSNGPPTTRPSTFLDDMVGRLQKRDTPGILVSSSDGVLMGYLWRSDAEAAMATGNCAHTWTDRPCSPSEI
jgi:CBS domain-containing protein